MTKLGRMTTTELAALLADRARPTVALVPCGSVEPHGPHLPLDTDTLISKRAIDRAIARLGGRATVVVAPPVPYGVTEYARSFAGAITIPPAVLTAFLRAVVDGLLAQGFSHVCLVNNHLEPEQDRAVRAALDGVPAGRASVACPLVGRWARQLSDEFRRGECHAGRYETSLVLAGDAARVRKAKAASLPEVPVSLSKQIKAGVSEFVAMGLTEAYAGAPAAGTVAEGEALYEVLGEMIATEILEAMAT